MNRAICLLTLLIGLGAGTTLLADASEQGCISSGGKAKGCSSVSMPEPSALPELALCAAGIGFLAWRRRHYVKVS